MARNNKARRKANQKRKKAQALRAQQARAPRSNDVYAKASGLMERRSWPKARQLLEEHDEAHPDDPKALELLTEVYYRSQDYAAYCEVCRRRLAVEPDNRHLHLMLAEGLLLAERVMGALTGFRKFLDRWPFDPLADGARAEIQRLTPIVNDLLAKFYPEVGDRRLEVAVANEEILVCTAEGEFERAIEIAEQFTERVGEFPVILNNVTQCWFHVGELDHAISVARRVLELQAENFHALSNLTRCLFLCGREAEARKSLKQLLSIQSVRGEIWVKKFEALATLGADEELLELFAASEGRGRPEHPLAYHLAGVAFARQGDRKQAERCWQTALRLQPGFEVVRENLADASRRAENQNGPWYFPMDSWGCAKVLDYLEELFEEAEYVDEDEAVRMVRRFDRTHPEFVRLLPALLDRGDPPLRQLAWQLAMLLQTPETIAALRTFCTSQRGTDSQRTQTAQYLSRIGALSEVELRIWLSGKWGTIELMRFDVQYEPFELPHNDEVENYICEAMDAVNNGEGKQAERLLQKCLELEGEAPDILNNLAAAYSVQGRQRDAMELLRRVHERWPDYSFARIALASEAIVSGNIELAHKYLAPLYRKKRLHITEFRALARVQINLAIKQKNLVAAKRWLELWQEHDPEGLQLDAKNAGFLLRALQHVRF